MHQVGGVALARVNSGGQDHCSAEGYFFRSAQEIRDDDHFAIVPCECLCQDSLSDFVLSIVCAELLEELAAVRVCIRVAVSAVDFVIIILEGDFKG